MAAGVLVCTDMREFTKALFSYSIAASLFAVNQTANILNPRRGARAFEAATRGTTAQLDATLRATFSAADNIQRGLWNAIFSFFLPSANGARAQSSPDEPLAGSSIRSEPRPVTEIWERRVQ